MHDSSWGKALIWGLVIGIASGAAVYGIDVTSGGLFSGSHPEALMFTASCLFALFALVYFYLVDKSVLHVWKSVAWTVLCTPSFYIAVTSAIKSLPSGFPSSLLSQFAVPIGGLVGGMVVAVSFRFFIARLTWWQWLAVLGVAMLASFAMAIGPLGLYVVWQTGVMLTLGLTLAYNQRRRGGV
jgi:hypothetical protein